MSLPHSALAPSGQPIWLDTAKRSARSVVEMEAAGLYGVAAEYGARALTIATVSDHIRTGEATTSDERQSTFGDMISIALDALSRDRG